MDQEKDRYIVSARKYRPHTFGSVVGQSALTATLRNAIDSGRLAQAYLFCGPRGVGKTSCARIFAKSINCEHPTADGEACGECDSCRAIDAGNSFNIIELDAASNNSVDDIRNLTDQVNVPPQSGRYRVFIIDEVHMLSSQAFNAFLKTLEEPPKYVVFILATTEKHKVIPTILSRCQIYDFKRITIGDMVGHLRSVADCEGIEAEDSALNVIARKADGAMRDALSIFDQVAASSMGRITYASAVESLNVLDYDYYFRLIDLFGRHDVQGALLIYKEVLDKGFDSQFFVNGLAGHIRDLMVAYMPETSELLEVGGELARQYTAQARSLPIEWYYKALDMLNSCDLNYRIASDKRLHVELCLIKLSRLGMQPAASQPHPQQGQPQSQPPRPQPQQARPQQAAPQQMAPQQARPQQAAPQQMPPQQMRPQQAAPVPASRPVRQTVRISAPRAPQQGATPSSAPANQPGGEGGSGEVSEPSGRSGASRVAISPGDVSRAWQSYIADHPEQHLLVSAMRNNEPQSLGGSAYRVSAEHPGLVQALSDNLQQLVEYLRARIGNSELSLQVVQSAPAQRQRVLTPREALGKVLERNHVIDKLLDGLNVEIV